jgi:hypothetical protein
MLRLAVGGLLLTAALALGEGSGRLQPVTIDTSRAVVRLKVEIAETREALARGLSGRGRLGEDEGMLFVIAKRGRGFWMKDVVIPLSVAFVSACGRIVEIQEMTPASRELHDTPHEYAFGLEVNQGWFARKGVAVGDALRLPMRLRGAGC